MWQADETQIFVAPRFELSTTYSRYSSGGGHLIAATTGQAQLPVLPSPSANRQVDSNYEAIDQEQRRDHSQSQREEH